MRRLLAIVAACAALVSGLAALSGCSDDAKGDGEVTGVGQARVGSVAALAQCRDWNAGGEEERRATIDDIYAQLNQAGADGPTAQLPADDAYALFDQACEPDYAAGFRLYKLYARNAAFSQLPVEP